MIPSKRWDDATLPKRHRALADEYRAKGYLANVNTVTFSEPNWGTVWLAVAAAAGVAAMAITLALIVASALL